MTKINREHPYAEFLHQVEKPARYLGGEFNSITKDWNAVDCRFVLCFPDVYDIGMSHLGTRILYKIVNEEPDLLMERAFCPWIDMEEALRQRRLPLVSLESWRPISDFDVVGFSLQYELTFTNVLTMLDLGGIPLHSRERGLDDPLVIAGGPVATQPEPLAPFIDAFLIGDAEERLPALLRQVGEMKSGWRGSREALLVELARGGGLYCPQLYETETCPRSGFEVVARPRFAGVPDRVERCQVDDISAYPFPADSPVPVAEAIFDRMSIEIARGCTEGCRFCQAGMIYRPVRERDPEQVIDTLLEALDRSGYDEVSITSLSTADYSCISPLIKTLMSRLRERKIGLGISSLRAYGLADDLLDEIASVKATGLTFAPEAGTQRMRDVINKNITEEDILTTCHRVFSKGWTRMKLYFMIGLPTEEEEDVLGIADLGRRAVEIGRSYHRNVAVTVSVSSHVPKPHTPFQWCAMDEPDEIERKQEILRQRSRADRFTFRRHDPRVSHLEGIIARGDRRVADLIESAWRAGARMDGWDERLRWELWTAEIAAWEARYGVDRRLYLGTIPLDGRLPWDHIDVGLDEGFLEAEYRKAMRGRLSPPCGKPVGAQVHHTNLAEAMADERRLVCYHCGIACDLSGMRRERLEFLEALGATEPVAAPAGASRRDAAMARVARGAAPHDFDQGRGVRFRLRFTKLGPVSLQGQLDLVREIPRLFRRAGVEMYFTQGFNPRPVMSFGPALGLGARSIAEYVDIVLTQGVPPEELIDRLGAAAPQGLAFVRVARLGTGAPKLSSLLQVADLLVPLTPEDLDDGRGGVRRRIEARLASEDPVQVLRKGRPRAVLLGQAVARAEVVTAHPALDLLPGDPPAALRFLLRTIPGQATLKPTEVARLFLKRDVEQRAFLRAGYYAMDGGGALIEPTDPSVLGEGGEVATRPIPRPGASRVRAEARRLLVETS